MRKLVSVIAAAGLLVSLSACTSGPFALGGCTPNFAPGSNSALVTAEGTFGKDPKATFPTPLVSKKAQSTEFITGDGEVVKPGDAADVQISVYNGKTGDFLISSSYDSEGLRILAVKGLPAFGGVVQCATVGSRVASVGTAGDFLGQDALDQYQLPIKVTDTVVMVVDVKRSFLGKANGVDQLPQAGFPSIVLAPNGRPGFTFPSGPIPTELKHAVLKAGNGAVVKKGDKVVLDYTGVLWDTKAVFDSTWESNAPATLTATSLKDDPAGVVPGFASALIGQKVGSQVIVVIPPKFGYPAGSAPSAVPDGSTMVFVFDILGIE